MSTVECDGSRSDSEESIEPHDGTAADFMLFEY